MYHQVKSIQMEKRAPVELILRLPTVNLTLTMQKSMKQLQREEEEIHVTVGNVSSLWEAFWLSAAQVQFNP